MGCVTQWDGRGLPPVAEQRVRRAAAGGVATSLLSVPSATSLDAVGFRSVGEVMGCQVQRIGWSGWAGCGYSTWGPAGAWGVGPGNVVPSGGSRFSGYGPYVEALTRGYRTALERMLLEAQALQADGVVGVRLVQSHFEGGAREFLALGTAVRAHSRTERGSAPTLSRPFTTDLPGTEVAALLLSGYVPVTLEVAIEVAIRHDDYRTRQQASSGWFGNGNVEVSGYTDLVQHTRGYARDKLARQVAASGAEGVVVSDMALRIWEVEPGENHRDHVAEATIRGTSVAAFHRRGDTRPAPRPLTVLPLRPRSGS